MISQARNLDPTVPSMSAVLRESKVDPVLVMPPCLEGFVASGQQAMSPVLKPWRMLRVPFGSLAVAIIPRRNHVPHVPPKSLGRRPPLSCVYRANVVPHWRRLAWQPTILATRRTRPSIGSRTAIKTLRIAMTTSSSMRVNPEAGWADGFLSMMDSASRYIAGLAFDCLTGRPLVPPSYPGGERKATANPGTGGLGCMSAVARASQVGHVRGVRLSLWGIPAEKGQA